jgi:cobalt-zinc-cadmium efflux system membrane fusion protein
MNTYSRISAATQILPARTKKWRVVIAAGLVLIVGIASVAVFKHRASPPADNEVEQANPGQKTSVKLSADKLRNANLHVAACKLRDLEDVRTVPGKITYNESQRWDIKTPVEGVVQKVLVDQSQSVKKGETLAVLSSAEIGMARDAVAQCTADLALARKEADRAEQIAANLTELLELLKQHPKPAEIEKKFDNKVLGNHRQEVVSAYSKLLLAETVAADTRPLEQSGTISGRLAQERHSDREVAKAAFETACEQSKFEINQAREKTHAAVEHAKRLLAVSCRRLETLGGVCSESEESSGSALSELVVRAPFDGIIQERLTVPTAHVDAGKPLFILANTDTLWVSAEVPERDWHSLGNGGQQELALRAPSLPDSETAARVKFIEGKISPETRTQTIVGELDNKVKKFRPGMFVWVSVPMSQPRRALAVPAAAIVDHEQARFVFVADAPDTFRRVDVTTGVVTPEWVEITRGLQAGDKVVDQGTFVLKSELLLEYATK